MWTDLDNQLVHTLSDKSSMWQRQFVMYACTIIKFVLYKLESNPHPESKHPPLQCISNEQVCHRDPYPKVSPGFTILIIQYIK